MVKTYLLIDYGASRVKTAIYKNKNLIDVQNYVPVKPYDTSNGKFVVSLKDIENQFRNIVEKYYSAHGVIDGIFICSEMHGFAVTDRNNTLISDYISWKDERSAYNMNNQKSSFEILKEKYGNLFFESTGMKPRSCYPFFNLYEYLKTNKLEEVKIISLPDWISSLDGQSENISHITMSAGLGFYNIYNKCFDNKLVDIFQKQFNTKLLFNTVSESVTIGGYIKHNNKNIPIYTGVGDHQCAVLGAGNTDETISLNLGTGSQVGLINSNSNVAEKRPFFDGKLMSVVTHIPSGRAFNTYIGFLSEINPNIDYWNLLKELKTEDILNSSLNIDLAVFPSAWNYNKYNGISSIKECSLTLKNYLSSLLFCYIKQFESAIEFIGEKRNKMILSGGIAEKIPVIGNYFSEIRKYDISQSKTKTDETFLGLCIIIDSMLTKEFV